MSMSKWTAMLVFALSLGMTSCGGDDADDLDGDGVVDEQPGESGGNDDSGDATFSNKLGVMTDDEGNKFVLSGIGYKEWDEDSFSFNYDESGKLLSYGDGWADVYSISYNPFVIKSSDEGEEYEYTGKLNSKGLVSTIKGRFSGEDEYGAWEENYDYSYSYNGSNQLTKLSCSMKGYEEEDGDKYNFSATLNVTLKWQSSNITKIEWKVTGKEEGESFTETYTYDFKYGDQKNKYGQYTCSLYDAICMDDEVDMLLYTGLLGVGPKMLPSEVKVVGTEKDEDYNGNYTCDSELSYELNDNGSIGVEREDYVVRDSYVEDGEEYGDEFDGTTYHHFNYSYLGESTSAQRVIKQALKSQKSKKVRREFFKKHAKK